MADYDNLVLQSLLSQQKDAYNDSFMYNTGQAVAQASMQPRWDYSSNHPMRDYLLTALGGGLVGGAMQGWAETRIANDLRPAYTNMFNSLDPQSPYIEKIQEPGWNPADADARTELVMAFAKAQERKELLNEMRKRQTKFEDAINQQRAKDAIAIGASPDQFSPLGQVLKNYSQLESEKAPPRPGVAPGTLGGEVAEQSFKLPTVDPTPEAGEERATPKMRYTQEQLVAMTPVERELAQAEMKKDIQDQKTWFEVAGQSGRDELANLESVLVKSDSLVKRLEGFTDESWATWQLGKKFASTDIGKLQAETKFFAQELMKANQGSRPSDVDWVIYDKLVNGDFTVTAGDVRDLIRQIQASTERTKATKTKAYEAMAKDNVGQYNEIMAAHRQSMLEEQEGKLKPFAEPDPSWYDSAKKGISSWLYGEEEKSPLTPSEALRTPTPTPQGASFQPTSFGSTQDPATVKRVADEQTADAAMKYLSEEEMAGLDAAIKEGDAMSAGRIFGKAQERASQMESEQAAPYWLDSTMNKGIRGATTGILKGATDLALLPMDAVDYVAKKTVPAYANQPVRLDAGNRARALIDAIAGKRPFGDVVSAKVPPEQRPEDKVESAAETISEWTGGNMLIKGARKAVPMAASAIGGVTQALLESTGVDPRKASVAALGASVLTSLSPAGAKGFLSLFSGGKGSVSNKEIAKALNITSSEAKEIREVGTKIAGPYKELIRELGAAKPQARGASQRIAKIGGSVETEMSKQLKASAAPYKVMAAAEGTVDISKEVEALQSISDQFGGLRGVDSVLGQVAKAGAAKTAADVDDAASLAKRAASYFVKGEKPPASLMPDGAANQVLFRVLNEPDLSKHTKIAESAAKDYFNERNISALKGKATPEFGREETLKWAKDLNRAAGKLTKTDPDIGKKVDSLVQRIGKKLGAFEEATAKSASYHANDRMLKPLNTAIKKGDPQAVVTAIENSPEIAAFLKTNKRASTQAKGLLVDNLLTKTPKQATDALQSQSYRVLFGDKGTERLLQTFRGGDTIGKTMLSKPGIFNTWVGSIVGGSFMGKAVDMAAPGAGHLAGGATVAAMRNAGDKIKARPEILQRYFASLVAGDPKFAKLVSKPYTNTNAKLAKAYFKDAIKGDFAQVARIVNTPRIKPQNEASTAFTEGFTVQEQPKIKPQKRLLQEAKNLVDRVYPEENRKAMLEKKDNYSPREIMEFASKNTAEGVPPELITAIVHKESSFKRTVKSEKKARGLMQVMRGAVTDAGFNPDKFDYDDPNQNLKAGIKYIAMMKKRFGDTRLALAAYNWGPTVMAEFIKRAGTNDFDKLATMTVKPFTLGGKTWTRMPEETRDYVPQVLQHYERYKEMSYA